MKKILQVLNDTDIGSGVMQVVYNWHKHIDTTKIQFDYLYIFTPKNSMQKELELLGAKVYKLNYRGILHPISFIKDVYKFFKTHHYTTIHSHITQMNLFYYPIAKMCGVKNIIQHAHGTKWSDKFLNGVRNYLMLHAVWGFITKKVACSKTSGKIWYKKNYIVVNNGIDLQKFSFNQEIRDKYRKDLQITDKFVIGHIGRFSHEKNHTFLLDVFAEVVKKEKSAILLLVGGGVLENQIKDKVKKLNLQNNVKFLGVRKDCENLYQAMDLFILPSTQEGLPMTGIEAQATGLPCVFSTGVPSDVLILPKSKRLSFSVSLDIWVNEILKYKDNVRCSDENLTKKLGFDIKDTTLKIQKVYEELF